MLQVRHAVLVILVGCAQASFAGDVPQSATAAVTFSKDVAPIIQNRCQECHRPGGVAPFTLMDYREVAGWSKMIKEVVVQKRMPPWHADPRYGRFENDRSLSDNEIRTLVSWIDGGTPMGDRRDLPRPRRSTGTWAIGKPDIIFRPPQEATLPATGVIPYHFYETRTGFTEDKWVQAVQTLPGNAAVVHHILVYIRDPRADPAERRLLGIGSGILDGYAPGDNPLFMDPGVGIRIPAGATLEWQIHYTPTGKIERDRSMLGIVFATERPKRELKTAPAVNYRFRIPPRNPNYRVDSDFVLPADAWLVALRPHMHYRGKAFQYRAFYPNGRQEILLSVPAYDFNWQTNYKLEQPLPMPSGTRIHCVALFDNSARNPYNPNPAVSVGYGPQSWDEMMIGWMSFVWDVP